MMMMMDDVEDITGIIPPGYGYRFDPTDLELVEYFLKRKINNEDLSHNRDVYDINVYASTPDHIAEILKPRNGESMYMFSPWEKKYGNGTRPNRTTGGGGYYWRQSSKKEICDRNNVHIGTATKLEYIKITGEPKKGIKTKWLMTEYTIVHPSSPNQKWNDLVLCKIYETPRQTRNHDTEQAKEDEEPLVESLDMRNPKRRHVSVDASSRHITSSSMGAPVRINDGVNRLDQHTQSYIALINASTN